LYQHNSGTGNGKKVSYPWNRKNQDDKIHNDIRNRKRQVDFIEIRRTLELILQVGPKVIKMRVTSEEETEKESDAPHRYQYDHCINQEIGHGGRSTEDAMIE
jgi:hypothetical protein